jgi:hypothetical protein
LVSPSELPTDTTDTVGKFALINSFAHYFYGQLLTASNWTSIWLSESFSTFVERNIGRELFTENAYKVASCVGNNSLWFSIVEYGKDDPFSAMMPDTTGINPIHAINPVTQEKGF